ncbi:MAG: hypothetical protein KAV41_01350 [Candidatus Pacebacteria bacterium]|nr:hypothetical protein [Candidatus Paceibacterota bacterium]
MLKIKKFFTNKGPVSVVLAVVLSVLFVVGIVEAATTISANINTAGTLTVTGTSTLTGAVTATAGVTSGANIVSDGNSADDLGTTAVRWKDIFVDGLTGNTITLDGATGVNILTIKDNVADGLSVVHDGTDFLVFVTTNSSEQFTITPDTSITGDFWVNGFATTTAASGNFETAGTLTAVGNSVLASADIGGSYTVNSGTGVTIDATGKVQINGALELNGFATTTAASGNIATAGTLTVVGNSTLASADIGGAYTVNSGTGVTIDATGNLQMNGALELNGFATTTAANGNIATDGSLIIGGGTAIVKHLSNSATLDFPLVGANSCEVLTIAVTGAADGDVVTLGIPNNIISASSTLTAVGWVSTGGTVTVRLCQVAALDTDDIPSGTVIADVWQH